MFSRLLVNLSWAILGLPVAGYFGDFASISPSSISQEGQLAFQEFSRALRVILKIIMATIGP